MKWNIFFKYAALVWFTIGISSSIKHWGGPLTEHPFYVVAMFVAGLLTMVVCELAGGDGE